MSAKSTTIWPIVSLVSIAIFATQKTKAGTVEKPIQKNFRLAYIRQNYPFAKSTETQYQVPALFTLAQAALESDFGTSNVALNSNNHFGIKADSSWRGAAYNGYRKYNTVQDSYNDHGKFLVQNKRYDNAFTSSDPFDFAKAIAKSSYSEDPVYYNSVAKVMKTIRTQLG